MVKPKLGRLFLMMLLLTAGQAGAADRWRISGSAAAGRAGDENYSVLGLGLGFLVTPGFEIGVDGEGWFRTGGNLYRMSPRVTYSRDIGGIRPYAGTFYRRTWAEEAEDFSSIGGRLGAMTALGPHTSGGAGIAFERILNCDRALRSTCTSIYPEANVAFSF